MYQWTCFVLLLLSCIALLLSPYRFVPDNYIRWSAILPSTRKEEIRLEVEDSTCVSIKKEAVGGELEPARKFRLPAMADVNGISARYRDSVLTIRVPRAFLSRGFFTDPSDLPRAMTKTTMTEILTTAWAA